MAKNIGKVFEQNWKNSVPKDVFVYRPPDAAQSFNMTSTLRFSSHSPCDFMVYDGTKMFCFELKTVEDKVTYERVKGDKGTIHYYQVDKLKEFSQFKNMIAGFIIDFRGSDNTYFVNISEWDSLLSHLNRKYFNENDLLNYTNPILINKKKLKVNYRYDVQKLLNDLEEN